MRFTTTMRGQPVTAIYTTASGQVLDVWAELADGGPAELTDAENDALVTVCQDHNALVQQSRATQGAAA